VPVELIVLGLATAVRPTSLAAVYALLASASPRRLLFAYVVAGAAFTVGFGLLVIWAFHGIEIQSGTSHTKAVAEVVGGVIALIFGALLATGRIGTTQAGEAPSAPGRWTTLLNQGVTVRRAAVAGPATHIPGIFYLIALNLIVSQQPRLQRGLLSLLLYNAVWFSLPLGALAVCVVDPGAAANLIERAEQWARLHARALLSTISLAVGTILLIRGLSML
jgi:hypothetical protein